MNGAAVETRRVQPRQPRRREDAPFLEPELASTDTVEDLRGAVLVFAGDIARPQSRAALSAGRRLADDKGVGLVCFAPPETQPKILSDFGVDALCPAGDDIASVGLTSIHFPAALLERFSPAHFVFADETPGGGVIGRSLAARMGVDPNVGVLDVERGLALCATPSSSFERREALARIVLVDARFPTPLRPRARQVRRLEPMAMAASGEVEDLGIHEARSTDLPVDEAAFILAGGAGVTDWTLFRKVADLLGAAAGASRVVVDAGRMPRERQIGASGATARADLYVALGISGAVQHLEGIVGCRQVISVNRDAHCAMAARADVAIQADSHAVLEALLKQLQERRR